MFCISRITILKKYIVIQKQIEGGSIKISLMHIVSVKCQRMQYDITNFNQLLFCVSTIVIPTARDYEERSEFIEEGSIEISLKHVV